MFKKLLTFTAVAALTCVFSMPAQAQFGKLGKSLGKAAKDAGKAVSNAAGEMATEMAAQQVATKLVTFMDDNNTVLGAESGYTQRLDSLVAANFTNVDGVALNYKVYESPEINILSLSDGSIRVYSAMMDTLNNDELLAVISTQIGHIANKDCTKVLMAAASGDNAENAGSAQIEKMLSFSGDKFGSVVNELIQVPYTEAQNKAADTYAYNLLKKKNVPTDGLYTSLAKFADIESTLSVESENGDSEDVNSVASKFVKVNGNNSSRASLMYSK